MSDLLGPTPPEPVKRVRADALERAERVWNARVMGGSWEQAAQIAGYSDPSNAVRAVRSIYGQLPTIERDEQRRLWRDRLEVVYRQVVRDVHDRIPGASTAFVRIADRAAKLDGLDAPTRLSLVDPTEEQIEAWLTERIGPRHVEEEADIFDVDIVDAEIVSE